MTEAGAKTSRRCAGPLLLTLGVVLVAAMLIALPWHAKWLNYQETAAAQAEQLSRFQARAARRPAVESALAGLQDRTGVQRSYIQGQTIGLGGANLQQLTKGLVEEAGARLISSQIATPESEPPLQRLVNKVRMRGDSDALLKLAHRVETGEPALFIENLVVRGARGRSKSSETEQLDIQFDLAAYMLLAGAGK